MKNSFLLLIVSFILISSCVEKEKPCPVPNNTININVDRDTSIVLFYDQTYIINLPPKSDSDIIYSWWSTSGLSGQTSQIIVNSNYGFTTIFVQITTLHGSSISFNITVYYSVSLMFYPSTFTPNRDGINDVWSPVGIDIENDSYFLQIFDKNDNLLFKTNGFQNQRGQPWNGTVDNIPCPVGYYYYVCKYNDIVGNKHKDSGMLQLIR